MKVLQINNNYEIAGGSDIVFANTVRLLREKGIDVVTLSRSLNPMQEHHGTDYLIESSYSAIKKFYSSEAKNEIEKIIINDKPDIIHLHCIVGGITFSILPVIKKYKIPVVMTVHDFRLKCPAAHFIDGRGNVCEKCSSGRYYNAIVNNCSPAGTLRSGTIAFESYFRDLFFPYEKYIDAYVFVSDFVKGKFHDIDNIRSVNKFIVHNSVREFGHSNVKGDYFLYLGRLAHEKGIRTLIDAFQKMPERRLKIAGSGPLRDEIASRKLDNVELLGFIKGPELEKIIQQASFIIVPSECYETLSLSAAEAFSAGKPVIGTSLGALDELISEKETGFRFIARSSTDLIRAVNVAENISQEEYKKLSSNAYEFAKKTFSEEVYITKLMNAYNLTIEACGKKN